MISKNSTKNTGKPVSVYKDSCIDFRLGLIELCKTQNKTFVAMKTKGKIQKINPSAVIMMIADTNYTVIHFENGNKLMAATTLKKFEKRFSASNFLFRSHKSFLINLRHVEKFEEDSILMKNQFSVLLSRRKKDLLKSSLLVFNQNI